jgi:uncharacterized protein (TIGR01777 family)
MNITITGANGFIGRRLVQLLSAKGHTLRALCRRPVADFPAGVEVSLWDAMGGPPPEASLRDADAVIHLAGEPVSQRWTAEARRRIRDSRVVGTGNLVQVLAGLPRKPRVLICSSAIGYYGSRGDELLTEDSAPGNDFLAEVCTAWEGAARTAESLGVRVVPVRTGVVLARHGGALAQMLPPFRVGVGGRFGTGRQWMSWIHLDDLCEMYSFALDHAVSGALNGVAPQPVTNTDFARELGAVLHRPSLFPVPELVLRLLLGEMSGMLLGSQRVLPRAAEQAGFRFRYGQVAAALADAMRPRRPS